MVELVVRNVGRKRPEELNRCDMMSITSAYTVVYRIFFFFGRRLPVGDVGIDFSMLGRTTTRHSGRD
jgi:hypothetical protein